MASPQWKSYVPPVADPAILAFQRTAAAGAGNMAALAAVAPVTVLANTNMSSNNGRPINNSQPVNNSIRETGVIEKLLHSYGFIQCLEREARLFFHYSEYAGNVETMKIGDNVEFQMSFDRKTGKPIACAVVKLLSTSGSVSFEILSEDQVTGTVAQEAKGKGKHAANVSPNQDNMGRVTYENKGECFFLPFALEDIQDNNVPKTGDEVAFYIATDKRNGNIRARRLRLLKPVPAQMFQGVVCSMKESFGFIERSDVVKEIFFHYSEYNGTIEELLLGDDVEFSVTTRNGKEVATNISSLESGTVIFEDIGVDRRRGKVQKTLRASHGRRQSDPLAGRIVYETVEGPIEIQYGDKDQEGDFTLSPGDLVEFNIATDRRDKLQRATNISLVQDTFKINGEKRETGVIAAVKDGFGFITCAEREARMFYHFSEFIDTDKDIKAGEEVEFTVIEDPTSTTRQIAIRIRFLPKGTVSLDTIHPVRLAGCIEKEPSTGKHGKGKDAGPGIIIYDVNGTKQTIPYSAKVVQGQSPRNGDKVEFQICESRTNHTKTAVKVKVLTRNPVPTKQGFVATLKDNYGFIETAEHDKEVFFHFSAFEGDTGDLDLGDEVEYTLTRKMAKTSAENIRKLAKGTIPAEEVLPGTVDGRVVRCMRIINPDQEEYAGLVQVGVDEYEDSDLYQYGITSLADPRDFLQKGDIVKYQIAINPTSGARRAVNVVAVRKYQRARVDSIKGQFGFLNHEVEDNKKLFFHMTEVHDNTDLHHGDEVEFVVVQNQRNGKYSAVSVRKCSTQVRPERLMSRLKSIGQESAPHVITIRQPRGPDNTRGFNQPRTPWNPPEE